MPDTSNPTSGPSIVVSYTREDKHWRTQVLENLSPEAQAFGVVNDEITGESRVKLDETIATTLDQARVLVVLLSPGYLKSSWIVTAKSYEYLTNLSTNGLKIIPVILHDCPWQEFALFREREVFHSDGRAVADTDVKTQKALFASLAREIVRSLKASAVQESSYDDISFQGEESGSAEEDQEEKGKSEGSQNRLTIEALSKFEFSSEVKNALLCARALATASGPTRRVSTTCLLFGLAEGGRTKTSYTKTPQFLFTQLTRNGEEAYKKEFTARFPKLQYPSATQPFDPKLYTPHAPFCTPNVVNVFQVAERISRQTYHPQTNQPAKSKSNKESQSPVGQIGARHLLAALLVTSVTVPVGAIKRLARIVSDLAGLRAEVYEFIQSSLPDDDHDAWKRILIDLELEIETEDELEADAVSKFPQPVVAGFMTDYWEGRDLLGITPDVNALASLVAAFKVEPPLAIGLFGEWGSGKSHFMQQLKARVEKLSRSARKSKLPQKELGYYKNIVQIEFNAWHYIEGNLWASLVDHIFANLRISKNEKSSFVEERRDTLMKELGIKKGMVTEKKEQLKTKEDGIRARVTRVNNRKHTVYQDLERLKDDLQSSVLNELNVPITFSEQDQKLLARIGVEPTSLSRAADVHKTFQQVEGFWHGVRAQIKVIRTDSNIRRKTVLLILLALVPVLGVLVRTLIEQQRLPVLLGSTATLLVSLLVTVKPYWDQFQRSFSVLKKKDEAIQNERQQQITQLENEIKELTKQAVQAEREAEDVKKQADKLEEEIETVTAGKLIAQFIEDRAAASDYRRHLGLLALIRRDFEKLRDLFREQRKEEDKGTEKVDLKKINRIVLYIDDLDRCPPERVVQVLQAIHLLLAFPLFVVVVGVDSRWVTRSLQQNYKWLHDENEDESQNGHRRMGGSKKGPNEEQEEGATPHDYLEKIFQIPFWLKPMDSETCIEFLEGLTLDSDDAKSGGEEGNDWKEQAKTGNDPATKELERLQVKKSISGEDTSELNMDLGQEVLAGGKISVETDDSYQSDPSLAGANSTNDVDDKEMHEDQDDDDEEIDVSPIGLKFSEIEVNYMKELAPLIGRSPRAVKRFLNCYRLIKVGLTPDEFKLFIGESGESNRYKAAMILLGVITGAPKVSSYVIEILDTWPKTRPATVSNLMKAFETNQEMLRQPDAQRLQSFIKVHMPDENSDVLVKEIMGCANRVSRFSFRVAGSETLGHKSKNARNANRSSQVVRSN